MNDNTLISPMLTQSDPQAKPRHTSDIAAAIVEIGWLATVVLVPLAVNPWGYNFELPKVALFRGLTLLMAAAHLVALAWSPFHQPLKSRLWEASPDADHPSLNPPTSHHSITHWLRRPLVRPTLAVIGAAILSTALSISPLTSLWGTYHRQQGAYLLLCFVLWALLIAAHLRTPAQRRRLATVIAAAGTLVALTPLVESLRWHENPLTWRPGGTLGNPIFLGAYLVMTIPFTAAQIITQYAPRTTQRIPRFLWSIALALQLFALLISQSRGPWVGALLGLTLFAALMLWPSRRRLVLGGTAAGALLIVALMLGLKAEPVARLPYVRRVAAATDVTRGTVRVRLVLWQAAADTITGWPEIGLAPDRLHWLRPALGYGPDTASFVYTAAYPPELAHIEDPGAIWDRAHNEALDLLTMRGALGTAAMLVLGIACARRGLALWREAENMVERAWVAAPLAALAAHAAEVQFAFSMTSTAMMAWLCVAWLAATVSHPPKRVSLSPKDRKEAPPEALRWRIYAAVAALLLTLAAVRLEGGLLWADTLVARARESDRAGQWKKSITLYDRALALIPWQATWYQFRAEAFYNLAHALPQEENDLRLQLLEAAERSLAHARRLEPLELEHHSNSGVLHAYWSETVDASHLETAATFYQRAFRLAPTRVRLRADLGHVYHNHGLYEEALTQYNTALEIDPAFVQAYYDAGRAWQALGRPDRAERAFRTALALSRAQ